MIGNALEYSADLVVKHTKPVETPLVFSKRSKKNFEAGHTLTNGAVKVSFVTYEPLAYTF